MAKLEITKDNASFKYLCKIENLFHEFISKSTADSFRIKLILEEKERDSVMYKEQEEKIINPDFEREEEYKQNSVLQKLSCN